MENKKQHNHNTGKLFLLPVPLGDTAALPEILPAKVPQTITGLRHYIAENEKTARHFIKKAAPQVEQSSLSFYTLNKFTEKSSLSSFLTPCLAGKDMGLLSEAGCPGIADPGAQIVRLAHQQNIRVIPLVGPSSITLAMMASGLNGQNFAFNGYLPIDKTARKKAIKRLEHLSFENNQAQIFMETPYRNEKLLHDLLTILNPDTRLCIARDITLNSEFISTKSVALWKKQPVDLHKKPTIFILQKEKFSF